MADKKFTLLELHLGDGTVQIGPATIGDEPSGVTEPEAEDADEGDGGCGCPGRKAGKLLLVLLVLALVVVVVKKVLGGSEELDELEALDEDEA